MDSGHLSLLYKNGKDIYTMTIEEVATLTNRRKETVKGWCDKKYIRGIEKDSETGEYIIPSSFKRPYTERATNLTGDGIYISIVKAILKDCDICAELYDLNEGEFNAYINDLLAAGIISTYEDTDTGITYFRKTLKSTEFSKLPRNKIKNFLKDILGKGNFNMNKSL